MILWRGSCGNIRIAVGRIPVLPVDTSPCRDIASRCVRCNVCYKYSLLIKGYCRLTRAKGTSLLVGCSCGDFSAPSMNDGTYYTNHDVYYTHCRFGMFHIPILSLSERESERLFGTCLLWALGGNAGTLWFVFFFMRIFSCFSCCLR